MYPNFLLYHLCSMENPDSLLFGGMCAQIFCSITIVRRMYTPNILLANVPKFSATPTLQYGEYRILPFWWQKFPIFCNIIFIVLGAKWAQIFCNIHTHAIIATLRSQPALNQIYLQFSSRTFGSSNLALYLPAGREASGSPGPFLDFIKERLFR